MAINSRAKGKRGEGLVANMFRKWGYDARRSQQFCGYHGDADVIGVPYLHIEVKWVQNLDIPAAMAQADRDSDAYMQKTNIGVVPVVIRKENRKPWMVTMHLDDLAGMYTGCPAPFQTDAPGDGLVHMLFDDWIKVYCMYQQWRDEQ